MGEQVGRWLRATGAVSALLLLTNLSQLVMAWQFNADGGSDLAALAAQGRLDLARQVGGEALGCLVLLALAATVCRFLTRGRRPLLIGSLLFAALTWCVVWFLNDGATEGTVALCFSWSELVRTTALPLAAGAWLLRTRIPRPEPVPLPAELTGAWDGTDGMLRLEADGSFSLLRGSAVVTGDWEPVADAQRIVLKVPAPTDLGAGYQATVLALDHAPDGGTALRADADRVYTRRERDLVVQASGGFVGGLEVIES
ncbi:hypothetical protein [Streptacidiphilus sp. EB129]|uniref:hypothetical protein n=1 Tax=Streptacidiphilus sp. EB129 TaxID=3156262 RepID=UPI003511F9F9